jgi:hypothetical protein
LCDPLGLHERVERALQTVAGDFRADARIDVTDLRARVSALRVLLSKQMRLDWLLLTPDWDDVPRVSIDRFSLAASRAGDFGPEP